MLTTALTLALLALTPAAAPGAGAAPRPIVIKAARLFDGKSEKLVIPAVIVVLGDRIQAAGTSAQLPEHAELIDLGDATLLPGFIDAHTHLSEEGTDDWKQDWIDRDQKSPPERALDAVPLAERTIRAGFTTCRDVGSEELLDVGLRNAIAHRKILGPRLLVSVHAIGATGGHCDVTGYRPGLLLHEQAEGTADGPDAIRALVRKTVKYGADVIKTCATGGVLSMTDDVDTPQLTLAELEALVDEAHALRRRVAAHAHGALGAKRAIQAGVDSIEHGTFLDDEAFRMMKQRGTVLIPTLMAGQGLKEKLERNAYPPSVVPKARAALAGRADSMKRALKAGVKIGFGTDAAVYPHGRNAEEFHLLVEAGLKPVDALRAAASIDADLLGISDRLGTLERGKIADVVAVPGDPLKNIRVTEQVFFVMKDGRVVRNDIQTTPPPAAPRRADAH